MNKRTKVKKKKVKKKEKRKEKGDKESKTPLLEWRGAHVRFGSVHAVNDVNLKLHEGELFGLLGDNGAGKTTLISTVAGVRPPDEGRILYKGEEVDINSVKDSRNLNIETVFQGQAVVEERTVAQNIFLGRELTKSIGPIELLDKERMNREAEKVMKELGLSVPSPKQELRHCSGGERQGVTISRAITQDADLVILDEPTTALSISGRKEVVSYIEELRKSGVTVIVISHNLNEIFSICDRFAVLFHGKKVADVRKENTSQEELAELQLKGEL